MTTKTEEQVAREWIESVLGRYDVVLPSAVASHVGASLAALIREQKREARNEGAEAIKRQADAFDSNAAHCEAAGDDVGTNIAKEWKFAMTHAHEIIRALNTEPTHD